MSKKYKITVQEVRKAAKKTGLKIEDGAYFFNDFNNEPKCACPLGQLYAANHKGDDLDGSKCSKWADKKFGQYFKKGFITAFDGIYQNPDVFSNQKNRQNYLDGYRNGKNLRRYLLGK